MKLQIGIPARGILSAVRDVTNRWDGARASEPMHVRDAVTRFIYASITRTTERLGDLSYIPVPPPLSAPHTTLHTPFSTFFRASFY